MSRMSYGADMFSPIRCDTSLDKTARTRESDVFFEQWKDFVKDGNAKNKKNVARESDNSSTVSSLNNELKPVAKSNLDLFKSVRNTDVTKNVQSFVTTRKKSAATEDSFKTPAVSSKHITKSKSSKRDAHITVRGDASRNVESQSNRIKQSSSHSSAASSLASVAEEQDKQSISPSAVEITKVKSKIVTTNNNSPVETQMVHNSSTNRTKPINKTASSLSNGGMENNIVSSSVAQKLTEIAPLTVECGIQTDFTVSDCCSSNTVNCHISKSAHKSPLQEIQANIIEKLVKDTVSYEFDGIRQMLYMQQLSLIKHMDKNTMASNENADNYNTLISIIEKLMEENRQLRNVIAKH